MPVYDKILAAIYDAIDEMNAASAAGQRIAKSRDTVLIGPSSTLDSLRFINLIVTVEQNVERSLRASISIMDAVIAVELPQWTIDTLAVCISQRLGAAGQTSYIDTYAGA